jgi:Fe-S-cluster-containing dehydrogenase component|uniref:4Fe-4S dicluster domain-containing protein n=1 Tax=candidate division WOR-3 bacterium TaxID=2052148 RepID=A0A7V3PU78_UNCW3
MAETGLKVKSRKRLFVRLDYCIGCRSCEAACRSRFKGEARVRYADLGESALVPLPCRHCDEPLCAAACPFEVIKKDEERGIVYQSSVYCVGCRSCILACPFGVLDKEVFRRIAQKCNLCYDRSEGPRCAASCPTGALQFATEEEVKDQLVGKRTGARHPFWRRV